MLVWRVEDSSGCGPYSGGHFEIAITNFYSNPESQPDPIHDFDNYESNKQSLYANYVFGFLSYHDAVKWFSGKCLRKLKTLGYKLRRVRARKIIISKSKRQIIFLRNDSIVGDRRASHATPKYFPIKSM